VSTCTAIAISKPGFVGDIDGLEVGIIRKWQCMITGMRILPDSVLTVAWVPSYNSTVGLSEQARIIAHYTWTDIMKAYARAHSHAGGASASNTIPQPCL
jgi:hypothetical protein